MPALEIWDSDRRFLRTSHRPRDPAGRDVRLVDLFAGCGGLSLGALEACRSLGRALRIALAVEADEDIAAVYRSNFTPATWAGASHVETWFDRPVGSSVSGTEARTRRLVGHTDLLLGGPPCQGHSPLNNHTRGKDPKNALYLRMVRAAEVLQPSFVLIENVPAIMRDSQRVTDVAAERLQHLGYSVESRIVHMDRIGVPQQRKRHVLVATCEAALPISKTLAAAETKRPRTVGWAIRDLVGHRAATNFDSASVLSPANRRRAEWLHRNGASDLPNALRPRCHREKDDHKYKSMYGRLRWDMPAQTITTGFSSPGQGRYLHPSEIRAITPHEAARLQSFPDWFRFDVARTRRVLLESIGNAVPPKLGFVLTTAILMAMAKPRTAGGRPSPSSALAVG
jgi:DNA (cytosine-5)-methyltransferase 1